MASYGIILALLNLAGSIFVIFVINVVHLGISLV